MFYSTYGYLCTSRKFSTPKGDLNKYRIVISTSTCISLLYEFIMNLDICYCYMISEKEYKCMCICISYMFPLSVKLSTGF